MKVISITKIPTGIKCKPGIYIKIFNRYIKVDAKWNEGFYDFRLFNITLPNKKSKTFEYFIDLYKKDKKINSVDAYNIASFRGSKYVPGYEGTIYGFRVIGFEGKTIKLRCSRFYSV